MRSRRSDAGTGGSCCVCAHESIAAPGCVTAKSESSSIGSDGNIEAGKPTRGVLRRDVVEEESEARLHACANLRHSGRAMQRVQLEREVPVGLVARRLLPDHHVREREVEERVVPASDVAQSDDEVALLLGDEVGQPP